MSKNDMNAQRYGVKRNSLLVLLSVCLLAIGLVACQTEEPEAATAEATTVSPAAQVDNLSVGGFGTVTAEGEVLPLRSADLSFQTGGTVVEIIAQEGGEVGAGDPLIRLDGTAPENVLRQAEAGLAAAEAAQAAAEAQLAVAQSGVQRAEAGITGAEAQLALVRAGATPEELEAAEKNLAAAEASIVQASGDRDAAVTVSDAAVRAAQARVAAAQADVDNLQEGYDQIINACFEKPGGGEICPLYGPVEENTRALLEAAKVSLEAAQAAEREARAGATPAQRNLAGSGVGLAAASRDQAQAQLELVMAGPREEQIQQAQVGVEQAKLGVDQAQVQIAQAEAAVSQAEAGVTRAAADVAAAQKALDRLTLYAPFAGRVGEINVELGELVGPGLPILRFADFGGWLVKTTDLTELDVVAVKNGLLAEVRLDAIPGEVISGVVTDIATVSNVVRGDVTYEVTIDLDEAPDLPLRWGMTAAVDIDTES